MTAKRLPSVPRPSGHRAEWNDGPWKSSIPSISGSFGRFRKPTAVMMALARSTCSPSGPSTVTCHSLVSSSHAIEITSVSNTMSSRSPYVSVTHWK